jgi:hypothetical protein
VVPEVLKWIVSALILAVIGLAIPVVRHFREVPPPPPTALSLTLGAPPGTELGSSDEPLDAAISPDERQIVFVATHSGTTRLWRRAWQFDGAEAIPGTDGAQLPAWDPTGDTVLFFAGGHLKQLVLGDGKVSEIADAATPCGATVLPDGSILFAPHSTGVIRLLRDGHLSDATTLRPGDRAHVFPFGTGVANDFVYTALGESGRRTVRLVHDRDERDLGTTSGHGQLIGQYLVVVRDEVLLAQKLDEDWKVPGRSTPLITGVGTTPAGRNLFVASSRMLLASPSTSRARQLAWFDMQGMRTGTIGEAGDLWQVRLSADDKYAAVTVAAPLLRTLDISLVPTSGSATEPLTLALAADSDPVWSPDGRRVAFKSLQTGRPALFNRRAHDKDANDEPLLETDVTPTDWRSSSILVHATQGTSGYDIIALDQASHTRTEIVKSAFNDTDGRWSPDGTSLAYVSDESGRPDIYARGGGGNRARVSFGGGTRPRWTRDGRSILFLRGSTVMRAMLASSSPASFTPAVPVLESAGIRDFDVAHQRDALLGIVPVGSSPPAPVSVMVDWQSSIPTTP